MRKFLQKICWVLIMAMMMCLFAGCSAGSTVDTILNVNADLSGSRVMTLVVDQSVYEENFSGTVEELNALIAQQCPSQISWTYDDSTGAMIYTFTLEFASPIDYKTKVDAIIGEGSDVTLTITQADSVWASGVYVEEGFTTAALLEWLQIGIVDAGFVSESNSSKVISLGNHNVKFVDKEYSVGSSISVDEIEYLDINFIDLITDVVCYDSYKKTIVMSIPDYSMNLKGDEIKSFLEARVPTSATAEWTIDGTDSIYTVSRSGMSVIDLEAFLNEFFGTDLCTVVQTDIRHNMSPFSFNIGLEETVDFTNYLVGQVAQRTDINYYVKGEEGYVGGRYLDSLAYYKDSDDVVEKYEGYRYGNSDYNNELLRTYSAFFQKVYKVSDVYVESRSDLFGVLTRETVFTLTGEPSESEQNIILENINSLLPSDETSETEATTDTQIESEEQDEAVEEVKLKADIGAEAKDGNYIVTIKQSGNRAEIQASTEALFGNSGDMYVAEKYNFAKMNYPIAMYDAFELGHFVDYVSGEITSTYMLNMGIGSKIESSSKGENAQIKNSTLTLQDFALYGIDVIAYGSQFNVWALLFYFFVVIFVGCIIILLKKFGHFTMFKNFVQEKIATLKAKETELVVTTNELIVEGKPENERPMFCGNCGVKRDTDALFCTECGTEFND